MKAMIFAAGLGSRLRPLTNDRPKALVKVAGKPMLEWVILRLKKAGYTDLVVNVHHFADKIEDFLVGQANFGLNIQISDEREEILETGGGLKKAWPLLTDTENVLIHNVDILSNIDLMLMRQQHEATNALSTLAISQRNTSRYLLFSTNSKHLVGWTNIKTEEVRMSTDETDYTKWAFSGIHLINTKLLNLITESGKFSIIDVYLRLAQKHTIMGFPHQADHWLDIGRPQNLEQAETFIQQISS